MKLTYNGAVADVPARATLTCDLARLTANYRLLTSRLMSEGALPMAVVKANAYGHGMCPVARALAAAGCRRFAVAELSEGLTLRELLPDAQILVLGPIPCEGAPLAAMAGLTLSVHSKGYAQALSQSLAGHTVAIHIKLNSGMNRYGFSLDPAVAAASLAEVREVLALPSFRPTGIYTHLAAADGEDDRLTAVQISRFSAALARLAAEGVALPVHLSASAALLSRGALGGGIGRLGLALYGYAPAGEGRGLLPVGRLSAPITQITRLSRGERVGYGGTFTARGGERIGILSLGYADGLPRSATGAAVRVAGFPCPIVGRVSMDSAAILLPDLPDHACGSATLFGEEESDLLRLARVAGTIPYEILARLGPRVERKYINGTDLGDLSIG